MRNQSGMMPCGQVAYLYHRFQCGTSLATVDPVCGVSYLSLLEKYSLTTHNSGTQASMF